jgi:hypothetical protein
LPGRVPSLVLRSVSAYSFAAAAPVVRRYARALRPRIAPPWSASALASQRVRPHLSTLACRGTVRVLREARLLLTRGSASAGRLATAAQLHGHQHSAQSGLDFCKQARLSHKSGAAAHLRTPHKMGRSKALGKGSATNQSPRNGPLRTAADICDSLASMR